MKKKLLNGVLVLAIAMIGLSIVGIFVLDGIAQSIIQTKGSEGLGVQVKVDNVHVGFFGTNSSINGLSISNPKEFQSDNTPNMLTVQEVTIEFNVFQLVDKQIEIPNVFVDGIELHVQQLDGKSNIETMLHHISSDETPTGEYPHSPCNIVTLTLSDIKVIANGKFTVIDSGDVTAYIPEIVLHNIGTGGDAELAIEVITSAITHAIMQHLAAHPVEGLSKLAFSHVTDLINELPVFKQLKIGHALQGATDTIGRGVDGILGGLDDILGGNNDDNK